MQDVNINRVLSPRTSTLASYCAYSNPNCFITFTSGQQKLWANGEEFRIKGINWYGSESRSGPPEGLDEHGVEFYLDFLSSNGFNAIRLLFNHESIIVNAAIDVGMAGQAKELVGLRYLDM